MARAVERLVVVGVGLIGGSLAAAARARGLAREVIGIAHRESTRQTAVANGVVDRALQNAAEITKELGEGDVVVLAVSPATVPQLLPELASTLSPQVTLTDVASTKGSVVDAVRAAWGEIPTGFVPGHPIAGTEKRGVTAADANLFERHRVILTPLPQTDPQHLARVEALWTGVGARIDRMDVEHHDHVLAATSHLPHVLAYSLVDTLFSLEQKREIFRYAAGGFRDFTRIAESDARMWRDIILSNRAQVLEQLGYFHEHVEQLRQAIDAADADRVLEILSRAQEARCEFARQLDLRSGEESKP